MKRTQQSIRRRVITSFLVFAVLQSAMFFLFLGSTNVINDIYNQSYGSYDFEVVRRSKLIQELFNRSRSGFIPVAMQINSDIANYMKTCGGSLPGYSDTELDTILTISAGHILEYLNGTKDVSGAFVILDNSETNKECVYIRDSATELSTRSSETKIYVRGPSSIAKTNNMRLHHLWQRQLDFAFLKETEQMDFFIKPLDAANEDAIVYGDCFYWSPPFSIAPNELKTITMTMPLIDAYGVAYGICGFELSSNFLKNTLPYTELGDTRGIYVLGGETLTTDQQNQLISGPFFDQLSDRRFVHTPVKSEHNITKVTTDPPSSQYTFMCLQDTMQLYNRTSMFYDEQWNLFALLPEAVVKNYPDNLVRSIILTQLIVLIVSLVFIYFTAYKIAKPVEMLSKIVGAIDPEDPDESLNLPQTGIAEIDELTEALELFEKTAAAASSRLSTIVNLTGVSIGGYEHRYSDNMVYLTDSLIKMFRELPLARKLKYGEWTEILAKSGLQRTGDQEDIYSVCSPETNETRWFRVKSVENELSMSGFITEITSEILELRRIEYERDHDGLTKLYNRKAFLRQVAEQITRGGFKIAAMVMIDLDNLKYINDTYGHDCGDKYICLMSEALHSFVRHGGIISRMAGDEFMIFLPSDSSCQDTLNLIEQQLNHAKKLSTELIYGNSQKLRFSTGIAWYPFDSTDPETLIKYSDFAMYETKHNIKGTVTVFDVETYTSKSFIRNKFDMLDQLIENDLFTFMFQPIVSAKTGEVFAYEMLMRSNIDGMRYPAEILSLAKAQSKLYYIERLCTLHMCRIVDNNLDFFQTRMLFFNTISSIVLKDDDWQEIFSKYSHVFKHVVIEITEFEDLSENILSSKTQQLKESNSYLAIDDFGSGYNGEIVLVKLHPNYVKIDMSLVRDISFDPNKQMLIGNIIFYCKSMGIKTIAEGIETLDEMIMLGELGIDYFQGFYLARPSPEFTDIPPLIKAQILGIHEESKLDPEDGLFDSL